MSDRLPSSDSPIQSTSANSAPTASKFACFHLCRLHLLLESLCKATSVSRSPRHLRPQMVTCCYDVAYSKQRFYDWLHLIASLICDWHLSIDSCEVWPESSQFWLNWIAKLAQDGDDCRLSLLSRAWVNSLGGWGPSMKKISCRSRQTHLNHTVPSARALNSPFASIRT